MGVCCSEVTLRHNVHKLPNEVPASDLYIMKQSHSVRFSQVTVSKVISSANSNQYKFVMKIFSSSIINDTISVTLNILNENIQKLLTDNYQLTINKQMIIDIFCKKLSSTLVAAKNQKSSVCYSIQIFSFRGYTSETFKKSLYAFYIIKKTQEIDHCHLYYHALIDHFVYGCNPDKQAFTLLFQRAQTSLANVIEYRQLAQWPWTTKEKLKIFLDIMNGIYFLHKKNIYHRDLRPSNILFIQRLGRYVIGSFYKCIEFHEQVYDENNRTVYGIQYMYRKGSDNFNYNRYADYLKENMQHAPYSPRQLDYHGLSVLLHVLETLDIINLQRNYKDKVMLAIHTELEKIYSTSFDEVRANILKMVQSYRIEHVDLGQDSEVINLIQNLNLVTHKPTIEDFMFQIYETLGYQKQFSNTAHQRIQRNNQQNKSLQNAHLLKNLAEFFEKNGAKGTQYYCNACLLFLKLTEKNIHYGNLTKAKEDYYHAEKCYIKFSPNFQSHSTYIQLHRIKALIKLQQNQFDRSLEIIKTAFQYGAKRKISIQKQMTLLLAYAKIHLKGNKIQQRIGEQKLKNGLAICENKGAFQNFSSCNLHTSNFLLQLGSFYHHKIKTFHLSDEKIKYLPLDQLKLSKKPTDFELNEITIFKNLAESNLVACLEIRQKQNIDVIDMVNVLKKLASFYYDVDLFIEAKKTFQRCINLLKDLGKEVNTMVIIETLWYFGSTLFSLKEFQQAQKKYQKALDLFKEINEFEANPLLKYNIEGNIGLVQFQLNKPSGDKKILEAMSKIKELKSDKFYDYVFLKEKYARLQESKRNKS